jgi:hypothetical protein
MEGFLPQGSRRWRDSYLKVAEDGGERHEKDEEEEDAGPQPPVGDGGEGGLHQGDRHHPHALS